MSNQLTPTDGYTLVEYGEGPYKVSIANCQTLKFHQEQIYDASGIDPLYSRFTVRVSGYLLAQAVAQTQILPNKGKLPGSPTNAIQTAGTQNRQLRHLLEAPRSKFKMTIGHGGPNPTVILEAKPFTTSSDLLSSEYDCQGGPHPKEVNVVNIVGNTSIKVEWECVVCIVPDCLDSNYSVGSDTQRQRGVLSNKWTCADDIDENFYIRSRTFVGELKLANPMVNPHDFRSLVVPGLQSGMRVKSMSFLASEDCLKLQYTIVHEEVTITAPYPATSIKISHKVHIGENQLEVAETLAITLKGDRDVDKQQLITLGCNIADYKIRLKSLVPNQGINAHHRLRHMEIVDECGTDQDNKIHIVYHMTHIPPENDRVLNGGIMKKITERIGKKIDGNAIQDYVETLSRGNRAGETAPTSGPISLIGAFVSHAQLNCTQDHSMNRGEIAAPADTELEDSIGDKQSLPTIEANIYPILDDLPGSTYSEATAVATYQTYEVDSQYQENPMVVQAPLSSNLNPYPSSAVKNSSAFVRLGPSQWSRIVRVVAQRHGMPPRLPNPTQSFNDENGITNVLLSRQVLLSEPMRTAGDEKRDYIIRAEYVYGLAKVPINLKTGIPDTDIPEVGSPTVLGEGPYSFTMAAIFSSDHPVG